MIRGVYHRIDDLYQRWLYERPGQRYRRALVRNTRIPDLEEKGRQLCRDGLLLLPGYFQGEPLRSMQEDFSRMAPGVQPESAGWIILTEQKGKLLRDSAALSAAAVDPFILSLVSYYWGKPVFLSKSSGVRLEPAPGGQKIGSFQWHHDARRKQVKVYVLLTDVGPDGQRMDYIPGTHTLWHRFQRSEDGYSQSRIPDEVALRYGKPVRCAGPAGTVMIFDTNGLHTGNRNLSARRDAWVFEYTAGRHVEPLSGLHPQVYQGLSPLQRMILRDRNLSS